jgi:AcrR family transcriptional regulator
MPRIGLALKDRRRRDLLEAADRCAGRMGFKDMTVDDVCSEAQLSKGAFYTYFAQKDDLLLALFEDDARSLDDLMSNLERRIPNNRERIRLYTQEVMARSENPAEVQVRADIWTAIATDGAVRSSFAKIMQARRVRLRSWIEGAIQTGELVDLPANALASILLALSDGLLLQGSADPGAFRWGNISKVLDLLLERMTP